MSLQIPVLLGTMRDGAASDRVAKYIHERLLHGQVESQLIDPETYRQTNSLELSHVQPWSDIMKQADGLIIVSPEYNHGYPGPLKEMIDALREEFFHKPVAVCGVSAGGLGGARVVEQLKLVMLELRMCPIRDSVYFSNVQQLFDEQGAILDKSYDEKCKIMFDELIWYANALKSAR